MLVSDGGDNCKPPDPCDVAKQISKGGIDLKIQAVGFQVKQGARRQLQCIAEAGGGRYVDADNAQELGGQLRALTARALRPYVTQGKRLEPTTEPATAKLYGPGQYTTEVSADSPAWYSFKVGAGQTLSVSATLPDSQAGIPAVFKAEIQDESLEFADSDAATNSGDVLTAIAETDVEEGDLRDPPNGRHFVQLEVDPAPGQSGPYPVELGVRVTGKVIGPEPTPEDAAASRRRRAAAPTTGRATSCSRSAASAGIALGRVRGRRGGRHRAQADRVRRVRSSLWPCSRWRRRPRRAGPDRGRRLLQRRAGAQARALHGHAAGRRAALLRRRAQAGAEAHRGRDDQGPHGLELLR